MSQPDDERRAFEEEKSAVEAEEEADNILQTPDETSDIILEVEGREFHTNRAVLAHYSPVFRKMLFTDFKEKDLQKIPLPGKEFKSMATFFQVLFPRDAISDCPVSDDNLIQVLALADEYQVDQVKAVCQNYIGEQISSYFYKFYDFYTDPNKHYGSQPHQSSMHGQTLDKASMIDKLTLYLRACDQYTLPKHRPRTKSLLLALTAHLYDVKNGPHYACLPDSTRIELLEDICYKLYPYQ